MRLYIPLFIAATLAAAYPVHAQVPVTGSPKLKVAEGTPDYWPGKYIKLPAGDLKAPSKLTYVTITKSGEDYQIEGFEGRKFRAANLNRSLDEFTTSSIITKPLARFGLGTATLQAHGVMQIVIDAFVGDDHFYLVRAEPLK